MNQANSSLSHLGNRDVNESEGSNRPDFFLSLFSERLQRDRAELEARERSSHDEDMRFQQERAAALRLSEVRARRFWTLLNALLIALAAALVFTIR